MHPEGYVYFTKTVPHEPETVTPGVRFFTEDFLNDERTFQQISMVTEILLASINELRERPTPRLGNIDAYVGIGDHTQEHNRAIYYLVEREKRRVFWMEKVDLNRKYFSCGIPIQSRIHLGE